MDHREPSLHTFISACLDWLEADDPSDLPLPSLEGMTSGEVRRARSWLVHLGETRDACEMVMALLG